LLGTLKRLRDGEVLRRDCVPTLLLDHELLADVRQVIPKRVGMALQAKKCLRLASLADTLAPQGSRASGFAAPGRREVRGRRRSRCPRYEVACSGVRNRRAHQNTHSFNTKKKRRTTHRRSRGGGEKE
jgi:hypothetical protein